MKFLRWILFPVLLLACAGSVPAVDLITSTVTVTNNPVGNTNTITVNSSTRTWTNSISASPSTLIHQTNSAAAASTNLLNHLTQYPASFAHFINQTTSTNVTIRGGVGEALSVTIAGGWAGVTYTTQTVSSAIVVRVPISVETATNQTNIASMLVTGLEKSTNALATNSVVTSNFLSKGASPQQTVLGPVQFQGRIAIASNFFATNGFTSALTNINPVLSNGVNYGNAFRSEGTGGVSLQLGSNAVASGLRAVAVGVNSASTNTDALAVGTGTSAGSGDVALGNGTISSGGNSTGLGTGAAASASGATAVGYGAIASGAGAFAGGQTVQATAPFAIGLGDEDTLVSGTNAVGIGATAVVSGYRAVGLGQGTTASFERSTAIGQGAETTTTNQVRLATSSDTISIPGQLLVSGSQSNTTFRGTNVLNGGLILTSRNNTGIADGNNAGVVLGTNVIVNLSGGTTIATICGFAAEHGDSYHIIRISGAVTNIIANQSGVDPTAGNRIVTGTGGDIALTNQPSYIGVRYNSASSRWDLIHWTR